ncbi:MAG: hypothetical protein ACI9WR_001252, partial [Paracoccaceae bacterium]
YCQRRLSRQQTFQISNLISNLISKLNPASIVKDSQVLPIICSSFETAGISVPINA